MLECLELRVCRGCGSFVSLGYCGNNYEATMRGSCPIACGFDSYCLASWCQVEQAPNVSRSEPGGAAKGFKYQ